MPSPKTVPEVSSRVAGDPPSFEATLARLSEIVERLEGGELPLEESLALFEEGVKLARTAQSRLDFAEKRVEELLGLDDEGQPVVRVLESDTHERE